MSEISRPSGEKDAAESVPDKKTAPRWADRNAFLRGTWEIMAGQKRKKSESELNEEDDDDSPESAKSKKVGRIRGKLMSLLVGKEYIGGTEPKPRARSNEQFRDTPITNQTDSGDLDRESGTAPVEPYKYTDTATAIPEPDSFQDASEKHDALEPNSHARPESAPEVHDAAVHDVPEGQAEHAEQHEPTELPAPVASQEQLQQYMPMPESYVHLRQQQETAVRQQEAYTAEQTERTRVRPEIRYTRDPQARRLAALATAGVVAEHYVSKNRDIKRDKQVQSQFKQMQKQTEATQAAIVGSRERAAPPQRPGGAVLAPQANVLNVPSQALEATRTTTVIDRTPAGTPEAPRQQRPLERLEPASVAVMAEANQRNLQELIEKRYDGARPEEILHKVEEAAEKNAAVENLYELRHEIRHDQGFTATGQSTHVQAGRSGVQLEGDDAVRSSNGSDNGFIANLQRKLQTDQQYKAVATGGVGAFVFLIILLVVLLLIG